MLKTLNTINLVVLITMTVIYGYHILYIAVGLLCKKRHKPCAVVENRRYAALICARNEASVIGSLVESLKAQNYPADLLDIYVLADNCTDETARVAMTAGAVAYRRYNTEEVGKGYALDYLLKRIDGVKGLSHYDGYFLFDADNIVDPNFVAEMNKTFCEGYDVLTSYRNSKNFATNWITYSYAIWFLHEARFINYPRMLLGNSCAVSGTGFLVSSKIMQENGGWPFHLLTEDIQFSVNCAVSGCRIGYCDKAVVYDEQPETFKQSWNQRMRWAKGFYQVDAQYLKPLAKGVITAKGRRMTCYDIMMTIAPGMLFSFIFLAMNIASIVVCFDAPMFIVALVMRRTVRYLALTLLWAYAGMFTLGLLTTISEWKQIHVDTLHKLIYLPLFPLFMATYIPIALVALIAKVEWKPIQHYSNADSCVLTQSK